jgi:outer membrane protein assembly factor BamB
MDPYQSFIENILREDKTAPIKQRHTSARIFERLVDEFGFTGGESTVRHYIRKFKVSQPGLRAAQFVGDSRGNFIVETIKGLASIGPNGMLNWVNNDVINLTHVKLTHSEYVRSNLNDILIDTKGNIYVLTGKGELYSLDSEGHTKWKIQTEKSGRLDIRNDYIYELSEHGFRAYQTADGLKANASTLEIPYDLKLPHDGETWFYVPKGDGIAKIDRDGQEVWDYSLLDDGFRAVGGPIISDAEGNAYFSSIGGSVYALDREGREKFVLVIRNKTSPSSTLSWIPQAPSRFRRSLPEY